MNVLPRPGSRGILALGRTAHTPLCGPAARGVIAAIASVIVPGLGQLAQGRMLATLGWFIFAGIIWLSTLGMLGWAVHILSAIDAALWKGRAA